MAVVKRHLPVATSVCSNAIMPGIITSKRDLLTSLSLLCAHMPIHHTTGEHTASTMSLSPKGALQTMGALGAPRSGKLAMAKRAMTGAAVFVIDSVGDAVLSHPKTAAVFTVVVIAGAAVAIFVVAAPTSAMAAAAAIEAATAKAAAGILAAGKWVAAFVAKGWAIISGWTWGAKVAATAVAATSIALAVVATVKYHRVRVPVRRGENRDVVEIQVLDAEGPFVENVKCVHTHLLSRHQL